MCKDARMADEKGDKVDTLLKYMDDEMESLERAVARLRTKAATPGVRAAKDMRGAARRVIREAAMMAARAELRLNHFLGEVNSAQRVAASVLGDFQDEILTLLEGILEQSNSSEWSAAIEDAGHVRGRSHGNKTREAENAIISALVATMLVRQARDVSSMDTDEISDVGVVSSEGPGPSIPNGEDAVYERVAELGRGRYILRLEYFESRPDDCQGSITSPSGRVIYAHQISPLPEDRENDFELLHRMAVKFDEGAIKEAVTEKEPAPITAESLGKAYHDGRKVGEAISEGLGLLSDEDKRPKKDRCRYAERDGLHRIITEKRRMSTADIVQAVESMTEEEAAQVLGVLEGTDDEAFVESVEKALVDRSPVLEARADKLAESVEEDPIQEEADPEVPEKQNLDEEHPPKE